VAPARVLKRPLGRLSALVVAFGADREFEKEYP
jgi:hypothetical protein